MNFFGEKRDQSKIFRTMELKMLAQRFKSGLCSTRHQFEGICVACVKVFT